jgi:dipeptidyl aminopeptidase/acylaminoacyl peptidase
VQLHHGTADENVPIAFSDELAQQIQAAGKQVEYYRYQGDNHNISKNFTTAMQRSIQFFDKYVKNRP